MACLARRNIKGRLGFVPTNIHSAKHFHLIEVLKKKCPYLLVKLDLTLTNFEVAPSGLLLLNANRKDIM